MNEQLKSKYDDIMSIARRESTAKQILSKYDSKWCESYQYIRLDALSPEHYDHGIADNSIFVEYNVNLVTNKIELNRCGHVWLSAEDKQSEQYRYFAMRSMVDIAQQYGVKKFRKQAYKDNADCVRRMEQYYKDVIAALTKYTGGYPYKEGKK